MEEKKGHKKTLFDRAGHRNTCLLAWSSSVAAHAGTRQQAQLPPKAVTRAFMQSKKQAEIPPFERRAI